MTSFLSNNLLFIVLSLATIVVLLALFVLKLKRSEKILRNLPEKFLSLEKQQKKINFPIRKIILDVKLPHRPGVGILKSLPKEWKNQMKKIGSTLEENQVSHIILMHGTFAGDDPLDFFSHSFELKKNKKRAPLLQKVRNFYIKMKDFTIGNIGNFTDQYCEILNLSLGSKVKIVRFHWPSGNHHLARLRGTFQLIEKLCSLETLPHKRILLLGHSHAGQIFAFMTQIISKPEVFFVEYAHCNELIHAFPVAEMRTKIIQLQKMNLDFVTLGASPRYDWNLPSHWKLIHFLNFRKNFDKKFSLFKLLLAEYGDTIYLLAGPGSDTPSLYRKDRRINSLFNKQFGIGTSLALWLLTIKSGFKIHDQGKLILIDYHDQGLKNIITSFLGHGIYTHPSYMLQNFSIICEELYGN